MRYEIPEDEVSGVIALATAIIAFRKAWFYLNGVLWIFTRDGGKKDVHCSESSRPFKGQRKESGG